MRTEITLNGTLVIQAESNVEGYALGKWAEDNAEAIPDAMLVIFDKYTDPAAAEAALLDAETAGEA